MRWLPYLLISALVLTVCTGWAIMFTGGQGAIPTPTATATPSNGVSFTQCVGNVGQNQDLQLTVTVNAGQGLAVFHKGVSNDPGISDNPAICPGGGTCPNVWYGDNNPSTVTGVNAATGSCDNFDYVTVSAGTGSDTVTVKSPGTQLFNSGVVCTVNNFAAFDVGSGTPYSPASGTTFNALTGNVTPAQITDTNFGEYHVETSTLASFSNSSTNSTIAPGTPTDLMPPSGVLGGTPSGTFMSGSLLEGAAFELGATTNLQPVGFQRSFSPAGNFCGGIVALTSAITGLSITPSTATISSGATQQFTATATLASGATRNVTGSVTWSSSNTNVATIAYTGLATAKTVAANTTITISASYKGKFASASLTVNAPPQLTSITVDQQPPNTNIYFGSGASPTSITLTATGHYSDGTSQPITGNCTWSANPLGIVSFSGNVATSQAVGTTTVTCTDPPTGVKGSLVIGGNHAAAK